MVVDNIHDSLVRVRGRRAVSKRPRWRRGLRLTTSPTAPFVVRWYRILVAQNLGDDERAYRLAIDTSRWAHRTGRDVAARRVFEVISAIQRHLPPDRKGGVDAFEEAARRAVRADRWAEAIGYLDRIIEVPDVPLDARRRALINRSGAQVALGRFGEALSTYDRIFRDADVWSGVDPMKQSILRMAREAAAYYVNGPGAADVQHVIPLLGRSPSLWQLYWWVLSHNAWDSPDRLESLRRSSLRTFHVEWDWNFDRLFWGIDLHLGWESNPGYFEERIKLALSQPQTLASLGRAGWMDVKGDWLRVLISRGARSARARWEEHMEWCHHYGYDGWLAYWRHREPR